MKVHLLLLGLVCLAAFALRFEGIGWPRLHPDEVVIGRWITRTATHSHIKEKVYPNGFFVLARPCCWLGEKIAYLKSYFAYKEELCDRIVVPKADPVMAARWFNVWTGTLICILGYLLALQITSSRWAGVMVATLLAFAQYPVEHSHYGETDMAMLLVLTFTLLLWAIAVNRKNIFWFITASIASGFAAGTKFQLSLFILLVICFCFFRTRQPFFWKGGIYAIGYIALGLTCFSAGFIVSNPGVLDWNWFITGLASEWIRVFRETSLNLGELRSVPFFKASLHTHQLVKHCQTLGFGWIALAIAGVPCLLISRNYRRHWPILLLFPVVYLCYWIFGSPWVRSQEFLNFLPVFAVLATLPLLTIWQFKHFFLRTAVIIFACLAITLNAVNGLRVTSVFGWKDTRLSAKQWLQMSLPGNTILATENYAEAAVPEIVANAVIIKKIENEGIKFIKSKGANYLLRTSSMPGRGLVHPFTFKRLKRGQELFEQFNRGSTMLRSFATLSPEGMAVFASPTIELYGLNHFVPRHIFSLQFPQPLWLSNENRPDIGRQTFFPVGHMLGHATGLLIDSRVQTIAIGGPVASEQPVYLIMSTAERPATINIAGFGSNHQVHLSPYDVDIIRLKRPIWKMRSALFETVSIRAKRVKDVVYLPCFLRVAFSIAETARICAELGYEKKVWSFFSEDELQKNIDPVQFYCLAIRSGRWNLAEKYRKKADKAICHLEQLVHTEPSIVRINGYSGYYYNQFSRIRFSERTNPLVANPEAGAVSSAMLSANLGGSIESQNLTYSGVLSLPVHLAHGCYTFSCDMVAEDNKGATNGNYSLYFYVNGQTNECAKFKGDFSSTWQRKVFSFPVTTGRQLKFVINGARPAHISFRNMELRWSLESAFESVLADFFAARVIQCIHQNDYQRALQLVAKCENLIPSPWNQHELDRLKSQALTRNSVPGVAFKEEDIQSCKRLEKSVVFEPFLELIAFSFNNETRVVTCVYKVLRDETPALHATCWLLRHGTWRKKQVEALNRQKILFQGEHILLKFKLNNAFPKDYSGAHLALGVETGVYWQPGALAVAGESRNLVPFATILESARK